MRWLVRNALPPMATFVAVVGLWHLAVVAFDLKPYLLPGPGRVLRAFGEKGPDLLAAGLVTGRGAAAGFGASLVVGFLVSLVFSQSRIVERSLYPYAIFLQTVPIVAIAPLVIRWFGTGFRGVAAVSFVISLFPIIANGTAGMTSVRAELLELFRIHGARRWQVLFLLRVPSAVPHLVTGARTSCGLAVVGAIVGEFFAGYTPDERGLGYLIIQTTGQLKTDLLFASILTSAFLGVLFFGTVGLVGSAVLTRWRNE